MFRLTLYIASCSCDILSSISGCGRRLCLNLPSVMTPSPAIYMRQATQRKHVRQASLAGVFLQFRVGPRTIFGHSHPHRDAISHSAGRDDVRMQHFTRYVRLPWRVARRSQMRSIRRTCNAEEGVGWDIGWANLLTVMSRCIAFRTDGGFPGRASLNWNTHCLLTFRCDFSHEEPRGRNQC